MYKDIIDAVTVHINDLFGDSYKIYANSVNQGLEEPCFFVQILEPSEKQVFGPRYYRETLICVQYIPQERRDVTGDLYRVADILMDGMEIIRLDDGSPLRGTGRRFQIVDGVLNFFVSYNMYVLRTPEKAEPMEDLTINAGG